MTTYYANCHVKHCTQSFLDKLFAIGLKDKPVRVFSLPDGKIVFEQKVRYRIFPLLLTIHHSSTARMLSLSRHRETTLALAQMITRLDLDLDDFCKLELL